MRWLRRRRHTCAYTIPKQASVANFEREERKRNKKGKTHCRTSNPGPISNGRTGENVVNPTRTNWRKVLYFESWVGWTEAEGREKSQ
jgi:hypothetical protein